MMEIATLDVVEFMETAHTINFYVSHSRNIEVGVVILCIRSFRNSVYLILHIIICLYLISCIVLFNANL